MRIKVRVKERSALEKNESICRSCFHSYVCEQFNEHRDGNNKKCHFYNDHFVHYDDVVKARHGKWTQGVYDKAMDTYRCSLCKKGWCALCNDMETFNYCPNCGAKLEDEEA